MHAPVCMVRSLLLTHRQRWHPPQPAVGNPIQNPAACLSAGCRPDPRQRTLTSGLFAAGRTEPKAPKALRMRRPAGSGKASLREPKDARELRLHRHPVRLRAAPSRKSRQGAYVEYVEIAARHVVAQVGQESDAIERFGSVSRIDGRAPHGCLSRGPDLDQRMRDQISAERHVIHGAGATPTALAYRTLGCGETNGLFRDRGSLRTVPIRHGPSLTAAVCVHLYRRRLLPEHRRERRAQAVAADLRTSSAPPGPIPLTWENRPTAGADPHPCTVRPVSPCDHVTALRQRCRGTTTPVSDRPTTGS